MHKAALAMRAERECDQQDDHERDDEQRHLDPALGILALDRAGKTIHHRLESLRTVAISEQPNGRENVLEGLPRVVGPHFEVAIGVTGDLRRAQLAKLRVHRIACSLSGGDQIDLVTLDHPAGDVAGIVWLELLGRKGLYATYQRLVHTDRGADKIVVEEVGKLPCGRLPP